MGSGGYSPVALRRLLTAAASLVEELGLVGAWASALWSRALQHRLHSCCVWAYDPKARGLFPDPGLSPCLLHWQVGSSPLSHQGSPRLANSQSSLCEKWLPTEREKVKERK